MFDLHTIQRCASVQQKKGLAHQEIQKAMQTGEGPCLTDCRLGASAQDGQFIIAMMGEMVRRRDLDPSTIRYRFKVLRHRDGKPAKPGDVIYWKVGVKTHRFDHLSGSHRPITSDWKAQQDMLCKRLPNGGRGSEHDMTIWHEAKVGRDGTIEVGFLDALELVVQHTHAGIHPMPSDESGTIWYHLVEELPPTAPPKEEVA
jgi:hypothetical protein